MKVAVLFCIALLCSAFVLSVDATETKIVLGSGHPDWRPAMYEEQGKIEGTAPEIVSKAFANLGMELNCSYAGSWTDVQELGKIGKLDVIVAAYKTPEREQFFLYSEEPIMEDDISLFSTQNIFYKDVNTLEGYNIAVSKGDSYGEEIDRFLASGRTIVNAYADPKDAMLSLIRGDNDMFLYSTEAGEKMLRENPMGFEYIKGEVITSLPFYTMVSKKSEYASLMPEISRALSMYAVNRV